MNDQPIWDKLMGYVFEKIRPLLVQVEQDTLYLELEEIALDLQAALNGKFQVSVSRTPKPSGPRGDERDEEDESSASEEADSDAGDDDGDRPTPARSRIEIRPVSDEDVEGSLCRAELRGGGSIIVRVNREHEVVQEALKAKPINRMALNMLTTREIADELAKDESVLERLFGKRLLSEIKDREDSQVQFIARLLIDRVSRVKARATA